jgi:hypothetical protein
VAGEEFPGYALADPPPTVADGLQRVFVDDELGREGFTYVLRSGREGSLHIDSVLEYSEDPSHMADLLLHELTLRARRLLEASRLSRREVIRRLGTSPSQLYRLLDPANSRKSMKQLLALLHLLGYDVSVELRARSPAGGARASPDPR